MIVYLRMLWDLYSPCTGSLYCWVFNEPHCGFWLKNNHSVQFKIAELYRRQIWYIFSLWYNKYFFTLLHFCINSPNFKQLSTLKFECQSIWLYMHPTTTTSDVHWNLNMKPCMPTFCAIISFIVVRMRWECKLCDVIAKYYLSRVTLLCLIWRVVNQYKSAQSWAFVFKKKETL
jgi:hypothetical protein